MDYKLTMSLDGFYPGDESVKTMNHPNMPEFSIEKFRIIPFEKRTRTSVFTDSFNLEFNFTMFGVDAFPSYPSNHQHYFASFFPNILQTYLKFDGFTHGEAILEIGCNSFEDGLDVSRELAGIYLQSLIYQRSILY